MEKLEAVRHPQGVNLMRRVVLLSLCLAGCPTVEPLQDAQDDASQTIDAGVGLADSRAVEADSGQPGHARWRCLCQPGEANFYTDCLAAVECPAEPEREWYCRRECGEGEGGGTAAGPCEACEP